MTTSDATFARNFLNQYLHFGPSGMVRKLGSKFIVEWNGRGFDTVFATKDEAMLRVRAWARMVSDWK